MVHRDVTSKFSVLDKTMLEKRGEGCQALGSGGGSGEETNHTCLGDSKSPVCLDQLLLLQQQGSVPGCI